MDKQPMAAIDQVDEDLCYLGGRMKLKPCPFCGGESELEQTGRNQLTIKCKKCLVKMVQKVLRQSLDWLEKKMIKNWNIRVSA